MIGMSNSHATSLGQHSGCHILDFGECYILCTSATNYGRGGFCSDTGQTSAGRMKHQDCMFCLLFWWRWFSKWFGDDDVIGIHSIMKGTQSYPKGPGIWVTNLYNHDEVAQTLQTYCNCETQCFFYAPERGDELNPSPKQNTASQCYAWLLFMTLKWKKARSETSTNCSRRKQKSNTSCR